MITKEHETEKNCLFCVSDYHLEMILLPYIKEKIDNSKFIIFTENNLEESLEILLTKVNLEEKDKEKIKDIDWKNTDDIKFEQIPKNENEKINIIINGSYNYIKHINNKINRIINKNIKIINCFHIGDSNVDISEISQEYNTILNTRKI